MPVIEGVMFDDASHKLVSDLIARLKLDGDFAVYALLKMNMGNGEIRLAHHGPDINHSKARGVFARFIPSTTGATYTFRKKVDDPRMRTNLSAKNSEDVLKRIIARRDIVRDRLKGFEKADPNKPGTVSGGQFESNKKKH